jgi:uncharacterized ferritin-like protein (DUF455 family)
MGEAVTAPYGENPRHDYLSSPFGETAGSDIQRRTAVFPHTLKVRSGAMRRKVVALIRGRDPYCRNT